VLRSAATALLCLAAVDRRGGSSVLIGPSAVQMDQWFGRASSRPVIHVWSIESIRVANVDHGETRGRAYARMHGGDYMAFSLPEPSIGGCIGTAPDKFLHSFSSSSVQAKHRSTWRQMVYGLGPRQQHARPAGLLCV
jgi:hypothetical protein